MEGIPDGFNSDMEEAIYAKMSDDPAKWKISPTDRFGRYLSKKQTKCSVCKQLGHNEKKCRKRVIPCYICGKKGHYATKCPNRVCGRCFEYGHADERCRSRQANQNNCDTCKERGHSSEHCTWNWKRFLTITSVDQLQPHLECKDTSCKVCNVNKYRLRVDNNEYIRIYSRDSDDSSANDRTYQQVRGTYKRSAQPDTNRQNAKRKRFEKTIEKYRPNESKKIRRWPFALEEDSIFAKRKKTMNFGDPVQENEAGPSTGRKSPNYLDDDQLDFMSLMGDWNDANGSIRINTPGPSTSQAKPQKGPKQNAKRKVWQRKKPFKNNRKK